MNCEFTLPPGFEERVRDAIQDHLSASAFSEGFVPSSQEIAKILSVSLWTSVLQDEGRRVNCTLNLRPGMIPSRVMPLRRPMEFTASQLKRIAMATTPGVSAVHVGPGTTHLEIFGIDTLLGNISPVQVEVLGPATIAVKAAGATVALISGNRAELIDLSLYAKYSFIDTRFPTGDDESRDLERRFFDIARAMHRHGHGGTLLVLGSNALAVSQSTLSEFLEPHYWLSQAFDGLRDIDAQESAIFAAMQRAISGRDARELFSHLRAAELLHSQYVSSLARTTAVDGASLVSSDGSLLAFGCKVLVASTPRVRVRLPTVARARSLELADFGGTRHQSAARFVAANPGSRAIVASQDGKVSFLDHFEKETVDCLEHAEWLF